MAHPGFVHFWKQEEMSDVEVHIKYVQESDSTGDEAPEAQDSKHTLLQRFPGHPPILSLSPYFAEQALRLSGLNLASRPSTSNVDSSSSHVATSSDSSSNSTCSSSDSACSYGQAQRHIEVTLPDASFEPAVLAALAGLYVVKPWPKLLADLTTQQQVHAAVLADMWQLPVPAQAAVGLLQAAVDSRDSLARTTASTVGPVLATSTNTSDSTGSADRAAAVLDGLLSLPVVASVPGCLLPLFTKELLHKYGNLEAVWDPAGGKLQESLLQLPLQAMELLLASDALKVASEDTVLYTAQAYVKSLKQGKAKAQLAVDSLAPLVRCAHLSQFWLSASVLSDGSDKLLLQNLQPQLKRLLLLRAARTQLFVASTAFSADLKKHVTDLPASWLLPLRDIQPVSEAAVEWEVDVAAIRQVAEELAAKSLLPASKKSQGLPSRSQTVLAGGVMWCMAIQCTWVSKQGCFVGLFCCPTALPIGTFCGCTFTLERDGADPACLHSTTINFSGAHTRGLGALDPFGVGAMPKGFDEEAWSAKGLPTTGNTVLRLTVKDVGMRSLCHKL